MSSSSGLVQPTGLHTPVSNQPPEAAEVPAITPISDPPSPGAEGAFPATLELDALAEGGLESASTAQVWVPPDEYLRDVGEASFPPTDMKETIHGVDNRVRVNDTAAYPWRVNASLLITAADGSPWVGTAWFIGPHTLVTAGHCVYIKNSGKPERDGWVQNIKVMPGRDGKKLPFDFVTSTKFFTVRGWAENGDPRYDYGAIIIPKDLGDEVGHFGFGVYEDEDLKSAAALISGYPNDQPPGTQWRDRNTVASVDEFKVYYDIDTIAGQSGSAVCRVVEGNKPFAIAIHAYGGATHNSGTRITNPVYSNLTNWKK